VKVNEIFYSLSGEGIHAGIPTVFIRLAGCNLAVQGTPCSFCDTSYAWKPEDGEEMSIDEVLERVRKYRDGGWALLTGGEPLYQADSVFELVQKLKSAGYFVEIETNGSIEPPEWYRLVDSWSADIKCPSSGVRGVSKLSWLGTREEDQIKFVVANEEDLSFVKRTLMRRSFRPQILVSPVANTDGVGLWDKVWLQEVAEFCKEQNLRYSLQQQKVIWGDKRGV